MLGLSFKGRTKKVLAKYFKYKPNSMQAPVLSKVASQAKHSGVNEYDAAIMFMLSQLNALSSGDPRVESFVLEHLENIERIIHLSASPRRDIQEMMGIVSDNLGLVKNDYGSFEDWIKRFKKTCAYINPQLSIDEGGGSLIDFMDHEPLKRAYEDGVSPDIVAEQFARSFDIKEFGLGA